MAVTASLIYGATVYACRDARLDVDTIRVGETQVVTIMVRDETQ